MPERDPDDQGHGGPVHQAEEQPESEKAVGLGSVQPPAPAHHGLSADDGIKQDKTKAAEQVKEDQRDHKDGNQGRHDKVHVIGKVDEMDGALQFRHDIGELAAREFRPAAVPAEVEAGAAEPGHAAGQQSNKAELEPYAQAEGMEQHGPDPLHGGRKRIKGG